MGFCAHTILSSDLLEVSDTHQDERFREHPLVTGAPRIRFYAGTPLVASDGCIFGTFCILGLAPKILAEEQRQSLRNLSISVAQLVQLKLSEELYALARQRFNGSFSTAVDGMSMFALDGRLLAVNPALCKMLGYSEAELRAELVASDRPRRYYT